MYSSSAFLLQPKLPKGDHHASGHMTIIPTGMRLRQDVDKFKANLSYTASF